MLPHLTTALIGPPATNLFPAAFNNLKPGFETDATA